jgi:hypothetical protein
VALSRTSLTLALALATLGLAGLGWSQYRELVELRAAAMDTDERAEWQKRAWDLEKLNRELQDELAALRAAQSADGAAPVVATAEERPGEGRRGGFRGGPGGPGGRGQQQQINSLRELVNKPEVQALMRVQQQAAVDARYAALFRNLNLPPEQLNKLKTLLADRQTALQDVMLAARDQGIEPRTDPAAFRKLVTDTQNDLNNNIRSLVGDSGFTQLQTYEQTLPQRNVVNDLQQRLSYTDTPLTANQADQLVQILAANTPQRPNNAPNDPNRPGPQVRIAAGGGPGGPMDLGGMLAGAFGGPGGGGAFFTAVTDAGGGRGGATAPVTQNAVTQAQSILAPAQVSALQQIQQQQQSQQQLQQLLRGAVGPGGGGNPGGNQPQPANGGGTGGNQPRRGGG